MPADQRGKVKNAMCYDPAAGSGTLLMALAHAIGERNCSIWSGTFREVVEPAAPGSGAEQAGAQYPQHHPGQHHPAPGAQDRSALKQFDYIVSNPPFKMDFGDFRDQLETDANATRFFAGIEGAEQGQDKMAIYLLFIQHIMASKPGGKAAVVVPTGFITAASGIELRIRQKLVEEKMIAGVVSMPSIFAYPRHQRVRSCSWTAPRTAAWC
ncbi:MAG: N-6 DNA methylase [Lysobacterales bacterium]